MNNEDDQTASCKNRAYNTYAKMIWGGITNEM
jgi:hypothetical protein